MLPLPSSAPDEQRRAAVDLLRIHHRAAREEQADLGFVVKRPEERRGAASLLRVDIRARSISHVRVSSGPNPAA